MYYTEDRPSRMETALLSLSDGYALLDELAQANINPSSISPDQLEHLLGRPLTAPESKPRLVRAAG